MLSEKIYKCRRELGLSQEQLAEKIGVSRQAISKWESGTATPELDKLLALSECFGITLDELVKGGSAAAEEPQTENGRTYSKAGAFICLGGAVCMVAAGAVMLFSDRAAGRLNGSSAVTVSGSGIVFILCLAAMAVGLALILRKK